MSELLRPALRLPRQSSFRWRRCRPTVEIVIGGDQQAAGSPGLKTIHMTPDTQGTSNMTYPKFQHWVPNFYLKKFASKPTLNTKTPKVFVIDKTGEMVSARLMSTKKICGKGYLNSPVTEDGNRDFSLEMYFSKIESDAASYWDEISEGTFPFDEHSHRRRLSEFIAALHLRNKFISDAIVETMRLRDLLFGGPKHATENGENTEIRPFEKELDPTDPGRFFAQSTKRDLPRVTTIFSNYEWALVRFDEEIITSDRPVTFETPGSRPGGPGNKTASAVVPISPVSALLMFPPQKEHANAPTRVGDVSNQSAAINSLVYRKAARFVLSRSGTVSHI